MVDFTPSGRTARFDVPAYADMADLQILLKRFAVRAAGAYGDTLVGDYTLTGNLDITGNLLVNGVNAMVWPAVRRTGAFAVSQAEARNRTTFLCSWADTTIVSVPSPAGLTDGARFTLIQLGAGLVQISGTTVDGKTATAGQWQKLDVVLSSNRWVSVDGPIGPTGPVGPNPAGGSQGDILTRGAGEGEVAWSPPGESGTGLPVGGTFGDVLVKQSTDPGDATWEPPALVDHSMPPDGNLGQMLVKRSNASYDVEWVDIPFAGGGSITNPSVIIAVAPYPVGGQLGSGEDGCWLTWTDPGTGYVYRIHKFLNTNGQGAAQVEDVFTVQGGTGGVIGSLLVVAGGGGGAAGSGTGSPVYGGGGGAGGCLERVYAFGQADDGADGIHQVLVGSGGVSGYGTPPTNGGNSSFDGMNVRAYGGGAGGANAGGLSGLNGGSGGGAMGAAYGGNGGAVPGLGTPGQGHDGDGSNGGGAMSVVGTGLTSMIDGSSVVYSEGGNGDSTTGMQFPSQPAGPGWGGGGGGYNQSGWGVLGQPGAQGIVICRYRIS